MNLFFTGLFATTSGILGAMGMGGGSVLIIFLTIFGNIEQSRAQGINLIFFIPTAITAIIMYVKKKLIAWKIAVWSSLFGIIGAFIGTRILSVIDNSLLSKIFGTFLLLIGIIQLFGKSHEKENLGDSEKNLQPSQI